MGKLDLKSLEKRKEKLSEKTEKENENIENLNQKMNIPTKFEGILEEDISVMARYASKEANPLYPVPKLMNAKELEKFYYMVSIGGKNEH